MFASIFKIMHIVGFSLFGSISIEHFDRFFFLFAGGPVTQKFFGVCDVAPSGRIGVTVKQMSNEKKPSCLGYTGDYTA